MTNYLVNIFIAFLKVGRPLLKGRLQIKYSFFLTLSGIWVGHGVNVGSASTRFSCTVGISIVVIRPTQQLWSNSRYPELRHSGLKFFQSEVT